MADRKRDIVATAAFAAAVMLVALAVVMGSRSANWAIAPVVFGLLGFWMSRVRLLTSLRVLMFLSLTLENPSEAPAAGQWESPLYGLGKLALAHMNQSTGVSWMSISGFDLLLLMLIAVAIARRASRSTVDGSLKVEPPKPLTQLAILSLVGAAFVWVHGLLRGGTFNISLWQVEKVTYLPILFWLFQAAIRSTDDYVAIGKTILAAAIARALLAIYIMHFVDFPGEPPLWATTHHDSMLFACAMVIVVSLLMHRVRRGRLTLLLLVVPIVVWGMVENNRRLVWAQIVIVFFTLYFVTPPSPAKRKIRNVALLASPLVLAYIVVGWNSGTGIFKPVGNIRSMLEPSTDMSTMWRDIENYNLASTIRGSPIFGLGYGHAFYQPIGLPPVSYPLEEWLPHNSILGLLFAGGFVGYTSITLLWSAGVYFGVRAYRAATRPIDRAIALVCFGAVLIYLVQCYGDLGLGSLTGVYMVSAALAVSGRLALATGAWPITRPKRKSGKAHMAVRRGQPAMAAPGGS